MIQADTSNGIFHLRNDFVSLVLCVRPDGDGKQELLMP